MLLEGAIGDAYGAGFEFADMAKVHSKNMVVQYETHPLFTEIHAKYTDDTQMSLAIAELLLENHEWTPLTIANKFVEVFKRDPRRGYAKRFYDFLQEVEDGADFLAQIRPKSERNGACMRAYPLGVLADEKDIIAKSALQASITHQTDNAIVSAQTIALISHFFIYKKGKRAEILDYLFDMLDYKWSAQWQGEVRVHAIDTVEAVLAVLLHENSLTNMLQKSVAFGGDVDTVASLVLALTKNCDEVTHDLPQFLYTDLENGVFGSDYIRNMDIRLIQMIKY